MKILIIMDPGIPVPPIGYGGHERLVYMFAKHYKEFGHEVDLLVSPGSEVEGCLVYTFGKEGFPPKKEDARRAVFEAWQFLWKHRSRYSLIHNFGRLAYLLPILNTSTCKIMTYGREITKRNISYINKLPNRNMVFTGCSKSLVSRGGIAGNWYTVYNAIEFKKYTLRTDVGFNAPLVFLGRLERVKGCHTAIKVAKLTGSKLIIAGNTSHLSDEQQYFKNEIEPFIDGDQIKYIGQVDDYQKNKILGEAKALLFPIEWEEPFGMVMIEAMACGTPVIGFNRGSVSEVITEEITGKIVSNEDEMIKAVEMIKYVDRKKCRVLAESQFDVAVIAYNYLSIFQQ
jgi:glycosyltransferase involved in cell wall biosynthesis